jgi:tetratricopeptide (TPR) repeat protein
VDSEAARGLPPRVYVPLVLLFGAAVIAVIAYFVHVSFAVQGSALGSGSVTQGAIKPVASRAADEVAMPQSGGAPDAGGALPGQSVGGGSAAEGGPPAEVVRLLATLNAKLKRNPNDVDALVGLGGLYAEANMFAKAAPYYARAVAVDPQNAQTRTAYAVALHGSGRDEAALRELGTALDEHRDFSPALYAQGVVAQALGKREVAVAAYKRFLSVAPDDPQAGDARRALQALGAT